jgi:hypothetical protein
MGPGGSIITSPNGIDWTVRSYGTNHNFNSITYGAGKWVAVGDSGAIITSNADSISVERGLPASHAATNIRLFVSGSLLTAFLPVSFLRKDISVSICDIRGRKIVDESMKDSGGELCIPLSRLPTGVYAVGIKSNGLKRFATFAVVK